MKALAEMSGSPMASFPSGDNEGIRDRGLRVVLADRSARAVTVFGGVWNTGEWSKVLAQATLVLLVLDPQDSRFGANRDYVTEVLGLSQAHLTGVVFTKGDISGAARCENALVDLLSNPIGASWPRFFTSAASSASLVAPFMGAWARVNDSNRQGVTR